MKTALVSCLVFFGVVSVSQTALADTKIVEVRVSDAIVPGGFDSNSDAFVIATGLFPNGCYKWAYAEANHIGDNITEIRNFATVITGPSIKCITMMVPWHKEIHLGKMSRGTHRIRFVNSDGTALEEEMQIE